MVWRIWGPGASIISRGSSDEAQGTNQPNKIQTWMQNIDIFLSCNGIPELECSFWVLFSQCWDLNDEFNDPFGPGSSGVMGYIAQMSVTGLHTQQLPHPSNHERIIFKPRRVGSEHREVEVNNQPFPK